MLSVVANTGSQNASAFKTYLQNGGWSCPGILNGNPLASAVGGGGGNYHALIYPDKRYVRVTYDIVPTLGLEKHVCGGTTEFKLVVNSGSGDGDHKEGASITIKADNAPSGKEFDKWTGDIGYLADPNSSTTTVTMPGKDISVTATYKDVVVTTFSLTVNSGSGDGDHAEGVSVTIKADTAPSGKEFDKWTGDVGYLADPNSSTTTVTMPAKDISVSATYKDKGPIVKKDNYMVISSWESAVGEMGSKVNIDSSAKADTVMKFTLDLKKSDEPAKKWAWAQISGYADGKFDGVTSVELVYYADNPVNIVLDQDGLAANGESYLYQLPAASRGKVTIPISDFKQPSWVATADATPLDLSKVLSVSFAAVVEEKIVNLEIQGIYLEGFEENTPISNTISNSSKNRLVISNFTSNKLVLNNIERGIYDISIFNAIGKKLVSLRKELAGNSTVDFKNKNLTTGAYVVKIRGDAANLIQTRIVK